MSSKQAIIDLEKRFWQAMVDKDTPTAVSMLAEPSMIAGAQGVASITGKDYAKMAEMGSWELHGFEMDKVQVSFPEPKLAVIGYIVTEDMTVDGKKLTLKAADTSVWLHRDDKWLCVLHTESLIGDSFGRDRKPAASQ